MRVRAAVRLLRRALPRLDSTAASGRRGGARERVLGGRQPRPYPGAERRRDVSAAAPLLEVRNLVKHFRVGGGLFGSRAGVVRAVDGVSFEIRRGETLGQIGRASCRERV